MINHKDGVFQYRVTFGSPVYSFQVINDKGKIFYERNVNWEKNKNPSTEFCFNINEAGNYRIVNSNPENTKIVSIKKEVWKPWKMLPMGKPVWKHGSNNSKKKVKFEYKEQHFSPMSIIPASDPLHVVYNKEFTMFPKYAQDFIFAHEIGHTHYKSEFQCDLYALNRIMSKGGNLSTCLYTMQNTLGKNKMNIDRLEKFIEEFKEGIKTNDLYGKRKQ